MILKVDFKQFLDEQGEVLALTEQAKTVFKRIIFCWFLSVPHYFSQLFLPPNKVKRIIKN
jgi:hypothetical protein